MTRFLQIAALLAILFALTSTAQANGHKGGGTTVSHGSPHKGTVEHGPSRTYSRDHHWSSRYWNSRWGCEYCYSSVDRCYFYYYAPACCYYPVTYIEQYPPTPVASPAPAPTRTATPVAVAPTLTPATVVQVNQNSNQNTNVR